LLTVFVVIMTFLLSKGVLKSPIVLKDKQEKETGYISSTDLEYLIGKQGITTTALRPAGRVKIEGVEFDVISDGRFIEKDKKVVIYKISNSSLVVKEI
jgi:membrane-bound ClpP family serine protease